MLARHAAGTHVRSAVHLARALPTCTPTVGDAMAPGGYRGDSKLPLIVGLPDESTVSSKFLMS